MINNYRRKLELKDDMYIRTSYGRIDKILELDDSYVKGVSQKNNSYAYDIDNIVKASYNIIDILKVGDYVNNERVEEIWKEIVLVGQECRPISFNNIKSIVTHEQMEQIAYKVGD